MIINNFLLFSAPPSEDGPTPFGYLEDGELWKWVLKPENLFSVFLR